MPSTIVLNLAFTGSGKVDVELNRALENVTSFKVKSVIVESSPAFANQPGFLQLPFCSTKYSNTVDYNGAPFIPVWSTTPGSIQQLHNFNYPVEINHKYIPERFQALLYQPSGSLETASINIILICEVSTDGFCG